MYVEDVEDGKRTYYTHFVLITSWDTSMDFQSKKSLWEAETESFPTIPSFTVYI